MNTSVYETGPIDPAPQEPSKHQRLEALHKANQVRSDRAAIKRDVKAGRIRVTHLLGQPPEAIATMSLADLLIATPKLGRRKVENALVHCRISSFATVGALTGRQRTALVYWLTRPR
jgi:hypothetical protein